MPVPLFLLTLAATAPAPDAPRQPAARDIKAPAPDAAADASASDVIVTATRAPTPIDRVVSSVTVLDKADIDRAQDIGVTEQLLRTPGVSISRNGGYGTSTSLRIRGAETDQTVVVIDGVKLNDPSSPGGGYNFGNLLVGDVARIEVLRGPQSVLWGSQAIGGVVNIVTATPTRPLEESIDVESGSRQTVSARAGIGGVQGPLTFRLGAQTFTTDGISAIAPAFGGTERDGYRNQSVTGRAELALSDAVGVELRGYYSAATTDIDGFGVDSDDYERNREFVGYAGLNVALFDGRLRNRLAYGYTAIKRDDYSPDQDQPLTFDALGRNDRIEYQGSAAIATGIDAVFGVDHERQRMRSTAPPYQPTESAAASLTGAYGQINATVIDGLTLTGGVREDDHSRYGSRTLFQGGGVWRLPTGTLIRASYGEGFKAPTLYQLYSDYGNRALAPEQATGWEAGAEQRLFDGALTLGATWFERRSRDLIVFAFCEDGTTLPACFQPGTTIPRFGYYANVSRAFAHGVEAAGALKIGTRLQLDGNYTWSPSEDRSPGAATNGLQLARRPRQSGNASVSYTLGTVTGGAALRWSGETFEDAAHAIRLAPYALIDLRGEVAVSRQVALFGRIENLLDKRYETAYRYGTLGRSFYAGFRGRF